MQLRTIIVTTSIKSCKQNKNTLYEPQKIPDLEGKEWRQMGRQRWVSEDEGWVGEDEGWVDGGGLAESPENEGWIGGG